MNLKGILLGTVSSSTFGMIPLFTIPLMSYGFETNTILFYRFAIAALVVGAMILVKRGSFRIELRQAASLAMLSLLYAMSALFLFLSYKSMGSGIATTMHFTYPIFTALIMVLFYKERCSLSTVIAIILAIIGVATLSLSSDGGAISPLSVVVVVASALAYALYIVGMNRSSLSNVKGLKLTFYMLAFNAFTFFVISLLGGDLEPIGQLDNLGYLLLLAIMPTIISNLALIAAVREIGSTLTAVLGAMEPLTAVVLGIAIFGESVTLKLVLGIIMIISAVTIIIIQNRQKS